MTPNVNLLPAECLLARRRALRVGAWAGVWSAGLLVVAGAWLVRTATIDAAERIAERLQAASGQRLVLEKQIKAVTEDRQLLINRLQALAALRPPQVWPARMATLARLAPDGVVLSYLASEESTTAATPAPPGPPKPDAATNRTPAAKLTRRAIQLRGLALAQDDVARLIDNLRAEADWARVELVRTTWQQIGLASAVSFEIKCDFIGDMP